MHRREFIAAIGTVTAFAPPSGGGKIGETTLANKPPEKPRIEQRNFGRGGDISAHVRNLVDYLTPEQIADAVSNGGNMDCTAAMQAAINDGDVFVPPGTYIIGRNNISVNINSNRRIYGVKGRSILKASSSFSTSQTSSYSYNFLLMANAKGNIEIDGISFYLDNTHSHQSKLAFINCVNITVRNCYFQNSGTWDLLFNGSMQIRCI